MEQRAPRPLPPLAPAVLPLLRASGGTRPARAPRCRPERPCRQLPAPGTPARRSPAARRPHTYPEPGLGRAAARRGRAGSAASPWPRPAGGTAPARRNTGSWWSAEAAWASRRSPSSSSRCLERACRGRRGGGGRGLALPVAGRLPRPRPGGAARAGAGGGAGPALLSCPAAVAPRSCLPGALLGVPGVGLLRNVSGRAELAGWEAPIHLIAPVGAEPSQEAAPRCRASCPAAGAWGVGCGAPARRGGLPVAAAAS